MRYFILMHPVVCLHTSKNAVDLCKHEEQALRLIDTNQWS